MLPLLPLLLLRATRAGDASVARLITDGSFGAEYEARGEPYIDLLHVRTSGGPPRVILAGALDAESEAALKAYGGDLKSGHIHLNSGGKYGAAIARDAAATPCDERPERAYALHAWSWHNAWHFWNDAASLGNRLATTLQPGDAPPALFVFGGVPPDRVKLADVVLGAVFAGKNVRDGKQLFKAEHAEVCRHVHWAVGPRVVGPVDGGGFARERRRSADFWRRAVAEKQGWTDAASDAPVVVFANRPCDGGKRVAMRCVRPDAVKRLAAAFARLGAAFSSCCPWSDGAATAKRFFDADVVVGPHGAGLANAMLAGDGLVVAEIHGEFGSEQDLFRKVADARRGGYVSVRGRGSGSGMTLSDADADKVAACALGLWRDGAAARRRNGTTATSESTRAACGAVGPDPGAAADACFLGTRGRLGAAPFAKLLEGAAPVGHDVDCATPGKPRPHYYVCPQAVDASSLTRGKPGRPGPPSDKKKAAPQAPRRKKRGG